MLEVWKSLPEGTLCELINNKLVMSPAPKEIHQQVLNRINVRIFNFLETLRIGEIRIAPYDVHFGEENILQPDLLFIENSSLKNIREDGLHGVPEIIIEISSPSSSQVDCGAKKTVYERFGVAEYYVVDPNTRDVNSYYLKDNRYEKLKESVGKIESKILETKIFF